MAKNGYLEVIAGPMFSGKTEELIRQIRRETIARRRVQVFKHAIDNRYGKARKVISHAGGSVEAILVTDAMSIRSLIRPDTEFVAIDEAQWFGDALVALVDRLVGKGIHVIVSGLAMTYDRTPFIPMPTLMTKADKVTILTAICSLCGADAIYHKRMQANGHIDPLTAAPELVSGVDEQVYQARCRSCYEKD